MIRSAFAALLVIAASPAVAQSYCIGTPQPARGLVLEIARIMAANRIPDAANTGLADVRTACLDPDGLRSAVCGTAAHRGPGGTVDRTLRFYVVADQSEHPAPAIFLTGKSAEAECRKQGMP